MNAEMLTILENTPEPFLDEMRYGGLFLAMTYNPKKDNVILELQTASQHRIVEIPKEKAMEARNHPCLFVDDAASLFKDIPVEIQDEEKASCSPSTKTMPYPYDQEKDFNPNSAVIPAAHLPFGRGASHCECCGKRWESNEPGYFVTSEDFIHFLSSRISEDELDAVLTALGDQDSLLACKHCLFTITGKDVPW